MMSEHKIHDVETDTEDFGVDFARNLGTIQCSTPKSKTKRRRLRPVSPIRERSLQSWQFETTIKLEVENVQEQDTLVCEQHAHTEHAVSEESQLELQVAIHNPQEVATSNKQSSSLQQGQGLNAAEDQAAIRNNKRASSSKATNAVKLHTCSWKACTKTFKSRRGLDFHYNTHTRLRQFKCSWPGCPKIFTHGRTEKRHRLVHTQENKYNCNWPGCTKSFTRSDNEKTHRMTHTEEKNFKCDSPGCEKTFRVKCSLISHKRLHTGEKPFACTMCDQSFAYQHVLKSHQLTHANEKSFKCPTCQKGFNHKSNLNKHIKIHSGEKPFACKICRRTFSRSTNKIRHEKSHAKKE